MGRKAAQAAMNHCQLLGYLKLHKTSTHVWRIRQFPPCCQQVTDELVWFHPFQAKYVMVALPGLAQQKPLQAVTTSLGTGTEI